MVLLAGLVSAWCSAMADIYQWQDANGKTHFGDRPPPQLQSQEVSVRVNTYNLPSDIMRDSTLKTNSSTVVLYTTVRCGYCKKAKSFLQKNNVPYTEYDVETSAKGKQDYRKLGGKGVPIILVGQQRMNGFSEARLGKMLTDSGFTL